MAMLVYVVLVVFVVYVVMVCFCVVRSCHIAIIADSETMRDGEAAYLSLLFSESVNELISESVSILNQNTRPLSGLICCLLLVLFWFSIRLDNVA